MKNFNLKSKQKGFTLIEVLVAMVIIAIGLMAIAALQYKAVKYNHDAYLRSQLNILAFDFLDRIRIDIDAVNNTDITFAAYQANAAAAVVPYFTAFDTYTVPAAAVTGCDQTAAFTSANAITCWQQQLQNALPPGSQVDMANGGTAGNYSIQISWFDKEGDERRAFYTFQLF